MGHVIRQRIQPPSRFGGTPVRTVVTTRPGDSSIQDLKGSCAGRTLNILACGPSINEVDFTQVEGDFMCVNKPLLHLNPKWWILFDDSQRLRNLDAWQKFGGTILSGFAIKSRRPNHYLVCQEEIKESFHTDGWVWLGKDTTYAATQLAIFLNYEHVKVWGLDKCKINGLTHFYGVNPDAPDDYRIPRFDEECYAWEWAADHVPYEIRSRITFRSPYNKRPFVQRWLQK